MKISLTTLAVLLSAAAVHGLPVGPPVPPPTISDEMSDNLSNAGDAASLMISGLTRELPSLSFHISPPVTFWNNLERTSLGSVAGC